MEKFRRITRKDIKSIVEIVDIQMKRARSYMRKRLTSMGYNSYAIDLEYKLLTTDNYVIIVFKSGVYGTKNNANERSVLNHIFTKDIPGRFQLPMGGELLTCIPETINPYFNDTFITMLDNAYDIYIPTSSRHGFNIFDRDDSDSKDIMKYMRDTMAWWHRLDDGPELIAGSPDDCSIYEYVLRNTHYI